jgi:cytochrome oxidase Cu insertion factor (SCO1/SenC/PrrC family)
MLLTTLLCVSPVLAACGSSGGDPPPPPVSQGIVLDRPIPDTPLISSAGTATSLSAYRGRYIVLAPFLSLCQDECPLVTGAFIASSAT